MNRSTGHIVVFALVVIAAGDLAFMAYLTLVHADIPGIFGSTFDRVLIALLGLLAVSPRDTAVVQPVNVVNDGPNEAIPVEETPKPADKKK